MVDKTVCKVGCLMTSVAMAVRYYNITINNNETTPGTLNDWLRSNGGYDNESDLYEKVLEKLSDKIKYRGSYDKKSKTSNNNIMIIIILIIDLTASGVVDHLNNGTVTIANVSTCRFVTKNRIRSFTVTKNRIRSFTVTKNRIRSFTVTKNNCLVPPFKCE